MNFWWSARTPSESESGSALAIGSGRFSFAEIHVLYTEADMWKPNWYRRIQDDRKLADWTRQNTLRISSGGRMLMSQSLESIYLQEGYTRQKLYLQMNAGTHLFIVEIYDISGRRNG